jgi:glutaredoxin
MASFKIVQISTSTCGPCKMARSVLTKLSNDKGVQDYYEYLDEKTNRRRFDELRMEYGVTSVPRFIVVDSNERFLDDLGGNRNAAAHVLNKIDLSHSSEEE